MQNININISNIDLEQLLSIVPSMPQIKGLLSANAHIIQTKESLQISADADINKLWYQKEFIGNIGVGGTWLPGANGEQNIKTFISCNNNTVLTADGSVSKSIKNEDSLSVNAKLIDFPLYLANAFVPTKLAKMDGNIDGNININGSIS